MTVANNYAPARYVGNGSTRSFAVSWRLENDDDFVVYQKVGGVQSVVNPSNYTAVNTDNEHGVVFNTAPANGTIIVITRATPHEQDTPYKTSSGFQAIKVEEDFDSLTMMIQELQNGVDRAVKVPETSTETQQHFSDSLFTARDDAQAYAQAAHVSEGNAAESATNAHYSEENAEIFAGRAETAATTATNKADAAAASATTAGQKAALAESYRIGAYQSELNAKDWAVSESLVDGTYYGARHYARLASESADEAYASGQNAAAERVLAEDAARVADTRSGEATTAANLAMQWAIKMDGKVDDYEYSAKYYADLAGQNAGVLSGANKDLSNLTAAGEARFTAKQDVISDLSTIRSGAALGDTSVQLSGAQTITGSKTFTAQPQFASGQGIGFNTDNGSSEHYVMRSSGNPSVGLSMFLNNDTSKAAFNISPTKITIGSNTILPNSITPSASDDSTRIATTAWVNSTGNNVVHRTGTETIAGTKTFTSDPYIKNASPFLYLDDTAQTKGTAPRADVWSSVTFHDANGNLMGRCRQLYANNKKNVVELQVHKANSSSDTASATLGVVYPASGSAYGFAPASDEDNSILTTVEEGTANGGWYAKLGNGWMIQQGVISGIKSDTETTVTFPKAFKSSTSYTIVKNYQSNRATEAADREMSFYSMTSTTAKTFTASGDTSSFSWVAIGKWK